MLTKEQALANMDEEIKRLEKKLERKQKERDWLEKQYLGIDKHCRKNIMRKAEKLDW